MAKKPRLRPPQQLDARELEVGPALRPRQEIRELDFDAPEPAMFAAQVIEAIPSADTVEPHADFFAARDALEAHFGGLQAMILSAGAPLNDGAGTGNILGFGVGFRSTSLSVTAEVAVKVYVREKLPLAHVDPAAEVPGEVDGLPTDVEVVGDLVPYSIPF